MEFTGRWRVAKSENGSETEHMDDQGPAPQQLVAGETDGGDDSTVSGVILAEPGVNVQAEVEAA